MENVGNELTAVTGLTLVCSHRYPGCGWAVEARLKVGGACVTARAAVPTHDEIELRNTKGKAVFRMPRAGVLEVLKKGWTQWTGPAGTEFRVETVGKEAAHDAR